MRRVAIRRIVLALVLALTAQGLATSVLERSLAEIFARADVIVYGEVTSVGTDIVDDQIRTNVEIAVARDIGGAGDGEGERTGDEPIDDVRTLTFLAGQTASGRTTVVDDVPILSQGDRILVAWYRDEGLVSPIVGVWQGLWRLGEEGLVDLRGRVLGVDDGVITIGGVERDVTTVLDAIETALGDAEGVRLDDRLGGSRRDGQPSAAPSAEPDVDPAADPAANLAADASSDAVGNTDADAIADADADADADSATPAISPAGVIGADSPLPDIELRLSVPDDPVLRSALEDAVRSWNDVGVPLRLVVDDGALDRVAIGSLAALGSDALAYSRRVDRRGGVELLLRPGPEGRRVDVLARELGRWIGLPDAGPAGPNGAASASTLRSGAFPPGDLLRPDATDAAALLGRRSGRPEDLDDDGIVDLYDLALLAEAYGSVGTRLRADLDGSGRVDDADLAQLEAAYEFLPPSRDAPSERRPAQD